MGAILRIVLFALVLFSVVDCQAQSNYISGQITLESIANPTTTALPIAPLTAVLVPSDGSPNVTRQISLSATGQYLLEGLPAKKFNLWIKGEKWLASQLAANTMAGDVVQLNFFLRAADATNDNVVDVSDLLQVINHYNAANGQANYSAPSDLNCDGAVDVADLLLVIARYNTLGDALTVPQDAAVYRVNCGSISAAGNFAPDAYFVGGSLLATSAAVDTTTVTYPGPAAMYQSARTGSFTYTFPNLAPDNFYLIRFHFADFNGTAVGQRQFNIAAQGTVIFTDFDPYAIADNSAVVAEKYVRADSSGNIVVAFSAGAAGTPLCNGIEVIQSPPVAPTNLETHTTGSGKMSIYWNAMPGATGYFIYRSTTEGGQNYSSPVNAVAVNTLSFAGSRYCIYTDTGLTNGTEYFYTVRAVYPAGISGPSEEDSDIVQASGIPWDTRNSGIILSAVRNAFSNVEPDLGELKIMAPDNSLYSDDSPNALPPDGTIDQNRSRLITADETIPLPVGGISLKAVTNGNSTNWPGTHRPTARRVSTFGFQGVRGDIELKLPSVRPADTVACGDTPEFHLGSHTAKFSGKKSGTSIEVDAGLYYGTNSAVPDKYQKWGLFLTVSGKKAVENPAKPDEIKALIWSQATKHFASGKIVNLTYYPSTLRTPVTNLRICLVIARDPIDTENSPVISLAAASGIPRDLSYTLMKRVHAIAQRVPAGGADVSNIRITQSHWTGVTWGQPSNTHLYDGRGQLADANGVWQLWTEQRRYKSTTQRPAGVLYELYLEAVGYIGPANGQRGRVTVRTGLPNSAVWYEIVDIFCQP